MKTIWQKCAERKLQREDIASRLFERRRKVSRNHSRKKAAIVRFSRCACRRYEMETIKARVALVNSMDLPFDEKCRRIAEIHSQERAA